MYYHYDDKKCLWKEAKKSFVTNLIFKKLKDYYTTQLKDADTNISMLIGKLITKTGNDMMLKQVLNNCGELFYDEEFVDRLDNNLNLISFKNGVYDLQKNEFRKRTKEDYLTVCLDYKYSEVPQKYIDEIKVLVKQICNDDETLCTFMMSWFAYCLTGETKECKFLDIVGHKASNGKSTLLKFFSTCFNIYYLELDNRTMNKDYTKRHKQMINCTKNTRLLHLEELEQKKLDVEYLKRLVDGGKIKNEVLFSVAKDIDIRCKLTFTTNHDMNFEADRGIMRRGMLVSFKNEFLEKEVFENANQKKGKYLENAELLKLFDDNKYKLAFFHLIKQQSYYNKGLVIPKNVREDWKNLVKSNDIVSDFLDQKIEITGNDEDRIHKNEFLDMYNDYTRSKTSWNSLLSNLKKYDIKYEATKRANGKRGAVVGVKMIDEDEAENPLDELF